MDLWLDCRSLESGEDDVLRIKMDGMVREVAVDSISGPLMYVTDLGDGGLKYQLTKDQASLGQIISTS